MLCCTFPVHVGHPHLMQHFIHPQALVPLIFPPKPLILTAAPQLSPCLASSAFSLTHPSGYHP